MRRVNREIVNNPESIVPLVGLDALPHGFKFQINMYQFGGARCRAIIPVRCLVELFEVLGVGQCPRLIHEAIYQQAHDGQISLSWVEEEELPAVLELFSRHRVEWEHFDA